MDPDQRPFRPAPLWKPTLEHYLHEIEHMAERILRLEKAIDDAVQQASPEIRAVIEALHALRGVAQTIAATIVSELGSLSRIRFVRVHRSAIVNIESILHLEPISHGEFEGILKDGSRSRISRTYRRQLEKRLGQSL